MRRGNIEQSLGGLHSVFVILAESTVAAEPSKVGSKITVFPANHGPSRPVRTQFGTQTQTEPAVMRGGQMARRAMRNCRIHSYSYEEKRNSRRREHRRKREHYEALDLPPLPSPHLRSAGRRVLPVFYLRHIASGSMEARCALKLAPSAATALYCGA